MPDILDPLFRHPQRAGGYAPLTAQEAGKDPLWDLVTEVTSATLDRLLLTPGFDGGPRQVLAETYDSFLRAQEVDDDVCTRVVGLSTFAFRKNLVSRVQQQLAIESDHEGSAPALHRLVALDRSTDQLCSNPHQTALVTYGVFGGIPLLAMAQMINLATRRTFLTFEEAKLRLRSALPEPGAIEPST